MLICEGPDYRDKGNQSHRVESAVFGDGDQRLGGFDHDVVGPSHSKAAKTASPISTQY